MNLPNKLTMLRIGMVPVFVASFYLPWEYWYWVAAVLFTLAFITDIIDGRIARSRGIVTDFGKFMDPIADKLLSVSALVMLSSTGTLSPIVTIIIIGREFVVSGLRLVAAGGGVVIAANWLGKAKTVSQFIMIAMLLLEPFIVAILGIFGGVLIGLCVLASTLLTIWSGVEYIVQNREYIDYRK